MSFAYVLLPPKRGKPVEQIVGTRAKDGSASGTGLLQPGVNELVRVFGGMGPRAAKRKAIAALSSGQACASLRMTGRLEWRRALACPPLCFVLCRIRWTDLGTQIRLDQNRTVA
jgi:hypothetical protein